MGKDLLTGLSQKPNGDGTAIRPHEQRTSTGRPRMILEYMNDGLRRFATPETVNIERDLLLSPR